MLVNQPQYPTMTTRATYKSTSQNHLAPKMANAGRPTTVSYKNNNNIKVSTPKPFSTKHDHKPWRPITMSYNDNNNIAT